MKAVVTCGTPGKVEVREIDVPKPGPTEILVKVFAAATNPTDCEQYFSLTLQPGSYLTCVLV